MRKGSCDIEWSPLRKTKSQRVTPPSRAFVRHYHRKRIETAGSLIESGWPKTIHAVTARGVALKAFRFVLAYSSNCLEVATWVNLSIPRYAFSPGGSAHDSVRGVPWHVPGRVGQLHQLICLGSLLYEWLQPRVNRGEPFGSGSFTMSVNDRATGGG